VVVPGGGSVGTRLPVGWRHLHLSGRGNRPRRLRCGAGLDLRPARLAAPRRIELGAMASDTSDKYMLARITRRQDYSPTLWSVWMKPPEELVFKAGQYVAFGVDQSEKVLERAFSIVSSPYESELEFFIERVPEGALSPKLYELQVGDQVFMRKKAKGIFNVDVKSGHSQHFLVSTVTGIAPYISMVRTLARDLKEGRLTQPFRLVILQGVSKSNEFGYDKELYK